MKSVKRKREKAVEISGCSSCMTIAKNTLKVTKIEFSLLREAVPLIDSMGIVGSISIVAEPGKSTTRRLKMFDVGTKPGIPVL